MRHLALRRFRPSRARPGITIAAGLLLAAGLCAPSKAWAAASAEEARAAVQKVLEAGDYQSELPLPKVSGGEGSSGESGIWSDPEWWRDEGDAQAPDIYHPAPQQRNSSGFDLNLPPAVVEALRLLMWGVIFAGVALLVYYLINEARLFSRWKQEDWQQPDEGAAAAGSAQARGITLEDCDRLAAGGDFAGAIHALLLHWIGRLRDRGVSFSSSMTSRELLRRLKLEEPEREALSLLVRLAELTHFGGRVASESDFRECRALYERVAAGGAA